MKQLNLLNSNLIKCYNPRDYIISESNAGVYQQLIVENWEINCKILYGKPSTGKTHLAHIWQENNNAAFYKQGRVLNLSERDSAYIIENIENITDEEWLLHLYNITKECNSKLLLTTNLLPKFLPYKLPDLRSRILSVPVLKLPANNDNLLRVILLKEFSYRQIKVSKEVIDYIISRNERSIATILEIVKIIDSASIESKRNITIPFVKQLFN